MKKPFTRTGMVVIAVPNRFTLTHDFSKAFRVILSHKELPLFESLE
ncbi:MAG: hypothetical protein ACHQUC_10170 [Chlamydiales bacterium]